MNFTRLSVSFKTPYAVSSVLRHNACVFHVSLHSRFFIVLEALRVFLRIATQCVCFSRFTALVFLYRLRHLTRFPLCGITKPVFYWRFCIDLDVFRVFLGWGHNACISHVYLYCLRHLTHFPLYGVTMHVFSRVSASFKTSFAFSSVLGHNAQTFTRLSVSFKTPYAFPYDWRQNASVFHISLHSRFFI